MDGSPEEHNLDRAVFTPLMFRYEKGQIILFFDKWIKLNIAQSYADEKARLLGLGNLQTEI